MSEQAKARLDSHHGGADFHDVMVRSFEGRFSEEFWRHWNTHVVPHHRCADAPVYADFGCGPGLMLGQWRKRWPEATLHGVELQPYMLQTAQQQAAAADATLHEADLHTVELPLPDGSLDAVLSAAVIHEMAEPIGMLAEIRRLLAPDGRLMVMDWLRVPLSQYVQRFDDDPLTAATDPQTRAHHLDHFMEHNKFTRDDLVHLLTRAGMITQDVQVRNEGQFGWIVASRAS